MKKIQLGTFYGLPIFVETNEELSFEKKQLFIESYEDMIKKSQYSEIDSKLAKKLGIKTKTIF
jgi:hypothetical protein